MSSAKRLFDKARQRFARTTKLPPGFAEAEYLQINPDVAHAVRKGSIRSGADHWLKFGASEGRWLHSPEPEALPIDFDERGYLLLNPDVKIAVENGLFSDGAEHWLALGRNSARIFKTTTPGDPDGPAGMSGRRVDAVGTADGRRGNDAEGRPSAVGPIDPSPAHPVEHWLSEGFLHSAPPYGFDPYAARSFGPAFWSKNNRVSFFGFLESRSGLGTSARNYLRALQAGGFGVDPYNVADGDRFEVTGYPRGASADAARNNKINIFHINADMTHRFFVDGRVGMLDDCYNIAIWFWELLDFPRDWIPAFGAFDEIWVASEFVRRSVASRAPVPVVKIPMLVCEQATSSRQLRSELGIPDEAYVFACVFDVGSVVERKNPQAAIAAFTEAFAEDENVFLLLKYHGTHHYPDSLTTLLESAAASPNILLVEQQFSDDEMQSFTNAIDCLVSPHRSEGFGLNIAETMLAEKSVIVTGYSGNMDFTACRNSYIVDYGLREVGEDSGPYPAHSLWADPGIASLALHMRSVFFDRDAAAAKARLARADMIGGNGVEAVAGAIRSRLADLDFFSSPPDRLERWTSGRCAPAVYYPGMSVQFSVIMILGNYTDFFRMRRSVDYVLRQAYPHWELILHEEGCAQWDVLWYLDELRGTDARIKISTGPHDNCAGRTGHNALAFSSYEFVVWLDHSERLHPLALSDIAVAILEAPEADVIYASLTSHDFASADEHARLDNRRVTSRLRQRQAAVSRSFLLRTDPGSAENDRYLENIGDSHNTVRIDKVLFYSDD